VTGARSAPFDGPAYLRPGVCGTCLLPSHACWCEAVGRCASRVPVVVLRHCSERALASNSARVIGVALTTARVLDHGAPEGPLVFGTEPGDAILWPLEGGRAADPREVRRLIVPDGTWRQARRMVHRIPGLVGLPRLVLPPPDPTVLRLRKPPDPHGMATAEAVASALRLLGDDDAADVLDTGFALLAGRIEALRGGSARLGGGRVTAGPQVPGAS
jgi:DTW domain-containing protein YfiP